METDATLSSVMKSFKNFKAGDGIAGFEKRDDLLQDGRMQRGIMLEARHGYSREGF